MLDLNALNPQQRLAVETIPGPILILAGAGTGKTRVITYRIAHMAKRGISPSQILAVTFTNKAAREMKERVGRLLPRQVNGSPERPTIATFHSLCVRILREHIHLLGYKRNFTIFNESEQIGAIKKILSQISVRGENTDPALILSFISRHKNSNTHGSRIEHDGAAAMAEHVVARYQSALRACNAVDFDDLLLLVLQLFSEQPAVLEECRARYVYVMVDEYQDTNAAQFKLMKLLAVKHRNVCVVGDDDQSIYGWRGAEVANLLDLEKHFPEVKVIKLEQNYRSTNTILLAANALIKNNARRRPKQLWSQRGHGTKILLQSFADDDQEARNVAEQIEFARLTRTVPWSHQAILFRTNAQSRPIETALRQAGIRYHVIGGQSYFDRREVRDVLAYLKFFLNPHDDVSLLRIANTPARGLSEATMGHLLQASHERQCSVFSAMQFVGALGGLSVKTQENVKDFLGFVERTRGRLESDPKLSLQAWTEQFLTEICYFEDVRRSEKQAEAAENRIRNIRELISTLDGDAVSSDCGFHRLQTFVEEVTLENDRDVDADLIGEAVTLITIHSCKGLEFPHVQIVGLEEGLLPHSRSKAENTLDEERRLFYVGITRAQETLKLSYCLGRKKYGQVITCRPSEFLKELPSDLLEFSDDKPMVPVGVNSGKVFFRALRASVG